jgi:peptidoglycan/LPS O-acetylase OafA/YrhL
MFFFLSGFLVSTSAWRLRSTWIFLAYRFFRIFPALVVEVVISAVLLGGMLSALPAEKYYTNIYFFKYFRNVVGDVQFFLPGVFGAHPCAIVNANLWTLPAEFQCYAIMAGLMLTRVLYNKKVFLGLFLLASLGVVYMLLTDWTWGDGGVVFVRPPLLVCSFMIGVFCFTFCDKILIRRAYFYLSMIGLVFFEWKTTTFLGVLSSCYLCLCIGFLDLRKFPLVRRGDYSYGIYLYGFPIQQTIWHVLPAAREWWVLFLLAFPLTLLFSIFSWRFIEKPFLSLKRHLRIPPPPATTILAET